MIANKAKAPLLSFQIIYRTVGKSPRRPSKVIKGHTLETFCVYESDNAVIYYQIRRGSVTVYQIDASRVEDVEVLDTPNELREIVGIHD